MGPRRRRGRIGGLRAQLLAGLAILLGLTLAMVALATLQFHNQHLQQGVADEARRHATWLSQIEDPLARLHASEALVTDPGVLHAATLKYEEPLGEEDPRVWMESYDGEPAIWAIDDEGEHLVVLSLADAQASMNAGRRALVLYLTLTMLFVTLVGYAFFSFVVIRPLRALGVATERAAGGDLARPIELQPRNEFGDVARQFNAMLDTLNHQRAALEDQLERLEQAHDELQQAHESLVRSEKLASVGQLAAGVAHEVGNPLAAVMGYTDLLRDRSLDEATADDLADRTLVQLRRIRQIIRQLLDYSRATSETAPAPVDLAQTIAAAVHLVEATPESRGITIKVDVEEDLPEAQGIAGELEQVLVNLLLNAVKALGESPQQTGTIEVRASESDAALVVEIVDDGPGIDDEVAERIFDPFFTTREPGQGTGLGLAIAHRLIARIDGDLSLISGQEGAHFRIVLKPCTDE